MHHITFISGITLEFLINEQGPGGKKDQEGIFQKIQKRKNCINIEIMNFLG